ncbi:NADH-cytochrome b5 reductase 1 [Amphibalanus amphitrite]|uniref:NADH-cytochrome b5 reductase 1 n=1 Tax=Amphibalanus amphitrite TaxID=1232801 RepID=A0A6A4W5M2_AMPAM|nr:NADH-cytochrome b5 reductase 1 [Amphibalanus amphitrite]KAF0298303.1 NADH-cytochrome b5 reductase 1 [Amphibalanus amphitrite]
MDSEPWTEKMWGGRKFWGVGSEFDPWWTLNEKQKKLQQDLMEICRTKIRPHAIYCDKTYSYPRESLNAMSELGLLGLLVPKELGGLGESHRCAAMVVETLARYGCPSTAMVYTMHICATAGLLLRHHNSETIKDILRRLDKDKLVGTLSYSDPATGGHFWFPLSSKCHQLDENHVKLLKYASWTTSSGFADFYAIQTVSPGKKPGDFSDLTCFLFLKDEVRANAADWQSLGMHGNQSGPLICEGVLDVSRRIGPVGDGSRSNDETVDPFFLLASSCCWNGIALACIDLVKKHVTRKAHGDLGIRVCDYPTIQDYFGESVCDTNSVRLMAMSIAEALDMATENNSWDKHVDLDYLPRAKFLQWLWQLKFAAAKNVNTVTDTMLHAAGGSGYKTDFGLERLLRDGKAGWVMGPSNEVLRQWVGKTVLLGMDATDYWAQQVNHRAVHHEVQKMTTDQKEALVAQLLDDVQNSRRSAREAAEKNTEEEEDFENPFSTAPPQYVDKPLTLQGRECTPGLRPDTFTPMALRQRTTLGDKMEMFTFVYPEPDKHSGCLAGQYVKIRIHPEGHPVQERYFSPVSRPDQPDELEIIIRFETTGILSQHFKQLKPGDTVEVQGPCGGFEYRANTVDHLALLASGAGVTPALQLIRTVMADPEDSTQVTLLCFAETVDDILLKDELDRYQATDKRLQILYSLGETPENWDGEEGFIDSDMIQRMVAKPNGRRCKIVLCGGPTMVISTLSSLRQLKYPARDIFVYGQFGVEQVRMVYGRYVELSGHKSGCAV